MVRPVLSPALALVLALASGTLAPANARAETRLESPHYHFDRDTLRRGAKLFGTYCTDCHSARHIRYRRLQTDLGLNRTTLTRIFTGAANGLDQGITSAMNPADAAQAFGVAPPDLTLEARYRGTDWIYSYLKGFYQDTSRPSGWNNHVFPNVAMPNILAPLQGTLAANGSVIEKGEVSPGEFDRDVNDITAWLQYTSDPSKLERQALGPWVIGFLVVFTLLAYALKRVYWRRVH